MFATDPTLGPGDGKGINFYTFTKDVPDKSNCAVGRLKAWPALDHGQPPPWGPGVDAALSARPLCRTGPDRDLQ